MQGCGMELEMLYFEAWTMHIPPRQNIKEEISLWQLSLYLSSCAAGCQVQSLIWIL